LERRFSHNLFIHSLKIQPGEYELIQELIEAVINSNTNLEIQFSVYGDPELVDYVFGVLGYLNVNTEYIKSKIL
jgi:hypothetical protein